MEQDIELSVIVPCLDEEENVADALDLLSVYLKGINHEVIVIDDQSIDKTVTKAQEWIKHKKVDNYHIVTKDLDRGIIEAR